MSTRKILLRSVWSIALASAFCSQAHALSVSRLTPPSVLFASAGGESSPVIARFVPGQRFDLQATVQPDAGQTISRAEFFVDGASVGVVTPSSGGVTSLVTTGLNAGLAANTAVASYRAYTNATPGEHVLTFSATQSNGATVTADGNFEIVDLFAGTATVKNVIILLGDGMGTGHRAAARIVQEGIVMGKAKTPLAMDTFENTAMIKTSSLNSIVTDSAPGMQNYVTGNKAANNQEGVFPDDTAAAFDNPRVEYLSEFLHRTTGKSLGIVTTADVFDATPASMAAHTSNRGAGSGIVDQFFDDRATTGLKVLMGGGRKWFLPNPTTCTGSEPNCGNAGASANFNGSGRTAALDYVLPADIVAGWGVAPGAADPARNLIGEFQSAGWSYASDKSSMDSAKNKFPLLGLFALSNMNVSYDKIGKRRGTSTIVDDYGFPDQPLLPEMTDKAISVLNNDNDAGFVLLVEGASIDKQAHNMDTDRFVHDTIEFDKAIRVAKDFSDKAPGKTLVIVTADHECAGASIIGASKVTNADLLTRSQSGGGTGSTGPRAAVGTYDAAGFPKYSIEADGYPTTMNPDFKMLIGYGANADRYEDFLANDKPLKDSQQPGIAVAPLSTYPGLPINQDTAGGLLITGQVPDTTAVHTANDVPLNATGRGYSLFHGTMDNTDVFFQLVQATTMGTKK
ncbi:alkaline phosphatase [Hydrocarboniphaga sp.]|uniref:alkaline phosphatase n=1 Tax=Hydrocarboniphaga sp. TaxID=2033016 RepID=UPI003D1124D8